MFALMGADDGVLDHYRDGPRRLDEHPGARRGGLDRLGVPHPDAPARRGAAGAVPRLRVPLGEPEPPSRSRVEPCARPAVHARRPRRDACGRSGGRGAAGSGRAARSWRPRCTTPSPPTRATGTPGGRRTTPPTAPTMVFDAVSTLENDPAAHGTPGLEGSTMTDLATPVATRVKGLGARHGRLLRRAAVRQHRERRRRQLPRAQRHRPARARQQGRDPRPHRRGRRRGGGRSPSHSGACCPTVRGPVSGDARHGSSPGSSAWRCPSSASPPWAPWPLILVAAVLISSFYSMIGGPISAIVPDRAPVSRRGLFSALGSLGIFVGGLIGVVIASQFVSTIPVGFVVLAGILLVGGVPFAFMLRDRQPVDADRRADGGRRGRRRSGGSSSTRASTPTSSGPSSPGWSSSSATGRSSRSSSTSSTTTSGSAWTRPTSCSRSPPRSSAVGIIVALVPSGLLSDRIGRRKPFVIVASFVVARQRRRARSSRRRSRGRSSPSRSGDSGSGSTSRSTRP